MRPQAHATGAAGEHYRPEHHEKAHIRSICLQRNEDDALTALVLEPVGEFIYAPNTLDVLGDKKDHQLA